MATLTITTDSGQDARIVAAFGSALGLRDGSDQPRDATAAEVKAAVISHIRTTVLRHERKEAAEAAADAVVGIDPT